MSSIYHKIFFFLSVLSEPWTIYSFLFFFSLKNIKNQKTFFFSKSGEFMNMFMCFLAKKRKRNMYIWNYHHFFFLHFHYILLWFIFFSSPIIYRGIWRFLFWIIREFRMGICSGKQVTLWIRESCCIWWGIERKAAKFPLKLWYLTRLSTEKLNFSPSRNFN